MLQFTKNAALFICATILMLLPLRMNAQGFSIYGQVTNSEGMPASFAKIQVCPYTGSGIPCTPLSNLYSNLALTTSIPNPYTTDQNGNYSFFVTAGATYILQVSVNGSVYSYFATAGRGGGDVSGLTAGYLPIAVTSSSLSDSPIDLGVTNSGVLTSANPLYVAPTGGADQVSMVVSPETQTQTSDIFQVKPSGGGTPYFEVFGGGSHDPGVVNASNGFSVSNPQGADVTPSYSYCVVFQQFSYNETNCMGTDQVSPGLWLGANYAPGTTSPINSAYSGSYINIGFSNLPSTATEIQFATTPQGSPNAANAFTVTSALNTSISPFALSYLTPSGTSLCYTGSPAELTNVGCSGSVPANVVLTNPTSSQTITQQNSSFILSNQGGTAAQTGLNILMNSEAQGSYNNSGPWNATTGINLNYYNSKQGINHGFTSNMTNETIGDTAWLYVYDQNYGGCYFGSDECDVFATVQLYQTGYGQANISTPTVGSISQAYGGGTNNVAAMWSYQNTLFTVAGNLATLSTVWSTSNPAPPAETAYFFLYTPGANNQVTVNTVIPVTLAASTGTQTWTTSTFGTIPVVVGQGLGFYQPTGQAPSQTSIGDYCLLNSQGTALQGVPVAGTVYSTSTTTATCLYSAAMVMQATLAVPSLGTTGLATSNFSCNGHGGQSNGCEGQSNYGWATGGVMLDMQNSPTYTATITAQSTVMGDPATYTVSGTPFPVSTAWGVISSCTNPGGTTQAYIANVCTVTLNGTPTSPGDFVVTTTPSQDVCLAGPYIEEAAVTAAPASGGTGTQTVTIYSQRSWTGSTVIMQGAPCGQEGINAGALVSGSIYYWPMSNFTIGAVANNQVLFASCTFGWCLGNNNTPTLPYSEAAHLTRTSNVVSAAPAPFNLNVTNFQGGTVVVSGCTTYPDLNGTFTVVTNSMDNVNPVLTWDQTGANEVDNTCTISTPNETVDFYPGAYINSSAQTSSVILATNQVNWTTGDLVRESPATNFVQSGVTLIQGQSTPLDPSSPSYGMQVIDSGPQPMYAAYLAQNTSGYGNQLGIAAPEMFSVEGSYDADFYIKWRPANNGTIIQEQGNEVYGGSAKPYKLFADLSTSVWIGIDPANNYMLFDGNVATYSTVKSQSLGLGMGLASGTNALLYTAAPYVSLFGESAQGNAGGASLATGNLLLFGNGTNFGLDEYSGSAIKNVFTGTLSTGALNFPVGPSVAGTAIPLAPTNNTWTGTNTFAGNVSSSYLTSSVYGNGVTTSSTVPTIYSTAFTGQCDGGQYGYAKIHSTALTAGTIGAVNLGFSTGNPPVAGMTAYILVFSGTLPNLTVVQSEQITYTGSGLLQVVSLPSPLVVTAGEYLGFWSYSPTGTMNCISGVATTPYDYMIANQSSVPTGSYTTVQDNAIANFQPIYVSGTVDTHHVLTDTVSPNTIYTAAGTPLPACSSSNPGATYTVGDATIPSSLGVYVSGGPSIAGVLCSYNGSTYQWQTYAIPANTTTAANSTLAVTSGTQGANSCSTATSLTITGVTTTGIGSHISAGYTADPAALTGWGSVGGMVFHIWPSAANTAQWEVCNQTASSITYSAITFSIGVQ